MPFNLLEFPWGIVPSLRRPRRDGRDHAESAPMMPQIVLLEKGVKSRHLSPWRALSASS
jgi:hypothetical protein